MNVAVRRLSLCFSAAALFTCSQQCFPSIVTMASFILATGWSPASALKFVQPAWSRGCQHSVFIIWVNADCFFSLPDVSKFYGLGCHGTSVHGQILGIHFCLFSVCPSGVFAVENTGRQGTSQREAFDARNILKVGSSSVTQCGERI